MLDNVLAFTVASHQRVHSADSVVTALLYLRSALYVTYLTPVVCVPFWIHSSTRFQLIWMSADTVCHCQLSVPFWIHSSTSFQLTWMSAGTVCHCMCSLLDIERHLLSIHLDIGWNQFRFRPTVSVFLVCSGIQFRLNFQGE